MTDTLTDLLPDWKLYLESAGKSHNTVAIYVRAAADLAEYVGDVPVTRVNHRLVRRYLAHTASRPLRNNPAKTVSKGYVNQQYRSLLQLFKWLHVIEEEITVDPMVKVAAPALENKLVPVIPDDDMKKLVEACRGDGFRARRDLAAIRILIDTGCRRAELIGLTVQGIQFNPHAITVIGKGERPRVIPFGTKTSRAIRRYLRVRQEHRLASQTDQFLIGRKGPMCLSALRDILERRCREAGVQHVIPHQFRHSLANSWLEAGGGETDLMYLAGWKSRDMLKIYGASQAAERARKAHRDRALGDRI